MSSFLVFRNEYCRIPCVGCKIHIYVTRVSTLLNKLYKQHQCVRTYAVCVGEYVIVVTKDLTLLIVAEILGVGV